MRYQLEPPSNKELSDLILKEMIIEINKGFKSITSRTENELRTYTKGLMLNSAFLKSVYSVTGDLRGEFGVRLQDTDNVVNTISDLIAQDTYLEFTPVKLFGSTIQGGWTLLMGKDLFAKVKSSPAGVTITEKNEDIPWLEWSLEKGNKVIIAAYRVKFGNHGRSGLAVMIPNAVIGWRIPPAFAGTDYDNWITREVYKHLKKYEEILRNNISKVL